MLGAVNSSAAHGGLSRPSAWAIGLAMITVFGALVVGKPTLLLNRSPSEPPGLYVRTGHDLGVGAIIAFRTPTAAFPYADLSMAYLHHRPLAQGGRRGAGRRGLHDRR